MNFQNLSNLLETYNLQGLRDYTALGNNEKQSFQWALGDQLCVTAKDISIMQESDLFPIAILNPNSSYMVTRSLLYSNFLIIRGASHTESEYWANDGDRRHFVSDEYIDLVFKYKDLIDRGLGTIAIKKNEHTCSLERTETSYEFDPYSYGMPVVTSDNNFFRKPNKNVQFPVLLPDVRNIELKDLVYLIDDEEIFDKYQNTLNTIRFLKGKETSEKILHEVISEVHLKTIELNSKFQELKSKRSWTATKALFGLSLTTVSLTLPAEILPFVLTIFGEISIASSLGEIIGSVRDLKKKKSNPYYFAWKVDQKNNSLRSN